VPAGAVGSVWANGSWPDTAWEAGAWAEAGDAPQPDDSINDVYLTGEINTDVTVTGEI
jgi:hypothetical protein